MITWSYGGGTQSIALAILIAQGRLPAPDLIVFADTGDEATETWEWMYERVQPLLARSVYRSIHIATHAWATVDTYAHNGDLLMPVFTKSGKLPTYCSSEWKTYVIHRYLRSQGVEHCQMWMGMSTDELGRLKKSKEQWIIKEYPLCLGYGICMNRMECRKLVVDFFGQEPPKSSCVYCPHRTNPQWQRLKMFYPQDFKKAVEKDYEVRANDKQGGVWLHESRLPLDQIDFTESSDQLELIPCDSGICWT
jgi:hypothetical protein